MAALRSFGSWSSLCIKASSASNYLHNTTVQRRYAQGVVQSASFLMQQRERKRKRDNKKKKPKINQWIYKNIPGNLKLRSTYTDWPSVFTGPQSYNPATIPVLFRMGRMKHNKYGQDRPKGAIGNIELSKIPTFFHLAPPAVERHCQALKSLCTEWPSNVDQSSAPLRVTTKNYLFAGPSLHHPGSRVVKLQVYLRDLVLDDHARKKLIELVEDRYDPETDELTIVTDRCPTRKQNRDYAMYLLSVLYHESWKTEPWEAEANKEEAESDDEDEEEIMQLKKKPKKPRPLKLINGELYRVNKFGKYFKLFINEKD